MKDVDQQQCSFPHQVLTRDFCTQKLGITKLLKSSVYPLVSEDKQNVVKVTPGQVLKFDGFDQVTQVPTGNDVLTP